MGGEGEKYDWEGLWDKWTNALSPITRLQNLKAALPIQQKTAQINIQKTGFHPAVEALRQKWTLAPDGEPPNRIPGIKYYKYPNGKDSIYMDQFTFEVYIWEQQVQTVKKLVTQAKTSVERYDKPISEIEKHLEKRAVDYSDAIEKYNETTETVTTVKQQTSRDRKHRIFGQSGSGIMDHAMRAKVQDKKALIPKYPVRDDYYDGTFADIDNPQAGAVYHKDLRILLNEYKRRKDFIETTQLDPLEEWLDYSEDNLEKAQDRKQKFIESLQPKK